MRDNFLKFVALLATIAADRCVLTHALGRFFSLCLKISGFSVNVIFDGLIC